MPLQTNFDSTSKNFKTKIEIAKSPKKIEY